MITWVFFALLTAIFWAASNIVDKYILSKKSPIVLLTLATFLSTPIIITLYFIFGVSKVSPLNLFTIFLASIFYISGMYLYCKAVQGEEVSRVIPMFNLNPMFIIILSFLFLGEVLTLKNYFGAFLIIIGAILISSNKKIKLAINKTLGIVILSSILFAINAVLIKYVLSSVDFWTAFIYEALFNCILLIPFMIFWRKDFSSIIRKDKKVLSLIFLTEILTQIGSLFTTISSANGPVGLVRTLQSVQPFFVFFFVLILGKYSKALKEDLSKKVLILKIVATILLVIGVILVTT